MASRFGRPAAKDQLRRITLQDERNGLALEKIKSTGRTHLLVLPPLVGAIVGVSSTLGVFR